MCKNPTQKDGVDSHLGGGGVDARFGINLTHSKHDAIYNAGLVFFLSKGVRRLGFFLFHIIVLLSLLILILKILIKDTVKAYFCYHHMLL